MGNYHLLAVALPAASSVAVGRIPIAQHSHDLLHTSMIWERSGCLTPSPDHTSSPLLRNSHPCPADSNIKRRLLFFPIESLIPGSIRRHHTRRAIPRPGLHRLIERRHLQKFRLLQPRLWLPVRPSGSSQDRTHLWLHHIPRSLYGD